MFETKTRAAICAMAQRLEVSPAALMAVVEVESGGRATAEICGKREPVIRFEGHYFDRFLKGDARLEARQLGLSNPKAGAVKNPRSQSGRWDLLNKAIRINRTAALSSVSWGVGQVMGSHWQWLGYGSADALVAQARSGIVGQIELMVRYIEKAGLVPALQAQDWAGFARRYNGPAYAKNKYDTKMAQAFARHAKRLASQSGEEDRPVLLPPAADGVMGFGSRGLDVKTVQKALTGKGYVVVADGLYGLITARVVRQFQRDHMLAETGVLGDVEQALLGVFQPSPIKRVHRTLSAAVVKASAAASQMRRRFRDGIKTGLLSISKRLE